MHCSHYPTKGNLKALGDASALVVNCARCRVQEKRRLADLSLKAEESKLWLETRGKKVERANRRKQIRLAEEKAQILDKHQKLDALSKQQKEFDKKRKV